MSRRTLNYITLPLFLFFLLLPRSASAQSVPEGTIPGPDVIVGDLTALVQAGANGTQVGLALGTTICNQGSAELNFFALPNPDHPLIPQNVYRMSGGANNDERFEQIGQSWAKHSFFALEQNVCGFGCTASGGGTHLGPGCSNSDSASLNGNQPSLGSRAWANPFTGIFPATASDHAGHTHDGTMHRILVEAADLDPAQNAGATYYGEAQLVTPHEYAWCQSNPGQCNMFNNVSYRRFNVAGTTTFSFTPVGATTRTSAINAWAGATVQVIEPEPGVDGRAFIAYKVTGPVDGVWQYEYAIYNENLDRGIQAFYVPGGCGFGPPTNLGFHAPLNHPGIANDGTVGNAGFSNAPWTSKASLAGATWSTETFAENPNANAIRWGTLYNFRFQHTAPPMPASVTIGFFKTGEPMLVPAVGPAVECLPTPSPTPTTPPPSPTVTPTASPGPTVCDQILTQNFDSVTAPALPPGWSSAFWVTSTISPHTAPNCAFVDDPAVLSDRDLRSPRLIISPFSAQISFRNSYDLESSGGEFFDGGVLEISAPNINGGAFTDVTDPVVGGNFNSGGYNATISDLRGSPLAGRQAWSGNSGGYIDTVVNLGPNVAGQEVLLRFRMASDSKGAGVGWRIDTMWFVGVCGILTPTPTPIPPTTPSPTAAPSSTPAPSATPTPSATPLPPSQALNISTRLRVGTGERVLIGGFIVTGSTPKIAALRGIGPSLAQFGLSGVLADPVLELRNANGELLQQNDNWQDDPEKAALLTALGLAPQDPNESGMVASLSPEAYTAVVSGKNGGTGVGLVEIYDVTPAERTAPTQLTKASPRQTDGAAGESQLANVSTRGFVETGENVMIGGFILGGGGGGNTQIAVRGIGPSLANLSIPDALADPTLQLRDGNGALLVANNDWQSDPAMAAELSARGLALGDPKESGIFVSLAPGSFTVILAGNNAGTGIAVVEIYNIQ